MNRLQEVAWLFTQNVPVCETVYLDATHALHNAWTDLYDEEPSVDESFTAPVDAMFFDLEIAQRQVERGARARHLANFDAFLYQQWYYAGSEIDRHADIPRFAIAQRVESCQDCFASMQPNEGIRMWHRGRYYCVCSDCVNLKLGLV